MKKRNIQKLKQLKLLNLNLTDKVLEKTLILKQLQLLRQSLFFSNFIDKNNIKLQRKLCLITSRSRAISQLTRTTRHCFLKAQRLGFLFGVIKASW